MGLAERSFQHTLAESTPLEPFAAVDLLGELGLHGLRHHPSILSLLQKLLPYRHLLPSFHPLLTSFHLHRRLVPALEQLVLVFKLVLELVLVLLGPILLDLC